MATGTETKELLDTGLHRWASAVVAGLLAGAAMGVPMQFVMEIMPVVGELYGRGTVGVGWVAHLFHSTVFALIFAGVSSAEPIRKYAGRQPEGLGVGVGYGVAIWVFGAV